MNRTQNNSKLWIDFAKDDLLTAEVLFKKGLYKNSILHIHQSVEKILKALICIQKKDIRKTHDLVTLMHDTGLKVSDAIWNFIELLNPYYISTRYPDTSFSITVKYDKKTASKFLKNAKEIIKWLLLEIRHIK